MLLVHGEDARPIAGGTAIQIFRHLGLLKLPYYVDLAGIHGLRAILVADGWLNIGAMATLRDVATQAPIPLLRDTFTRVANVRVRSTATAGGNLAHGDFRIDPPAALLPLDASVDIFGPAGSHSLPLADFFTSLEDTALGPGELLATIRVPMDTLPDRSAFWKFSSLAANDWPCFGAGICLWLDEAGHCRRARAGITAMSPTPLLLELPMLAGRAVDETLAREAGAWVADQVDPIPDLRGSAAYKRRIAAVCTADALRAAWSSSQAKAPR
jgi:aerobic carbon-monoxide dehydrogenase medium subunit